MFGRKKYDEVYEEDDDQLETGETFVPPQKLSWVDYVLALALGLLATVFSWGLSYKGLHPDLWLDCSVVADLRSTETLTPGYWRLLAAGLFKYFGLTGGISSLLVLGKLFLGILVALGYLTFKEILSILVNMTEENRLWTQVLSRCLCAVTAVIFLCAEPVWSLGVALSPVLVDAVLFSLIVFLFAKFLGDGHVLPACWVMFFLGMLGAETPLGLIALFGFWLIFYILLSRGNLFYNQLLHPLLQQSSKWYLTFFWALGLGLGITINILSFKAYGGMDTSGITSGTLPVRYVTQLWQTFIGAASGPAWIVGVGAAFLPFVLGIGMLRRATDQDYFLSYHVGIVFFVIGCLAYSQMASLPALWFWKLSFLSGLVQVSSKLLLFLCAQMTAIALLCALTVTVIDTYFRDHRRLASQFDATADENSPKVTVSTWHLFIRSFVFFLLAVLLIAGVLPFRFKADTKRMMTLVDDYVREVVTEAGDAKFIFTDGSQFDCGFELESARRGGSLRCLSLHPEPTSYARRGEAFYSLLQDEEDKTSASVGGGNGGANLLRMWQRDKPERLESCALLCGLELWRKRAGLEYPPVSGLLAKTKWTDDQMRLEGVQKGRILIKRVLDFYEKGVVEQVMDETVKRLFLIQQWRLARQAAVRAEVFDRAGALQESELDADFARELDDKNEEVKNIQNELSQKRLAHLMRQRTLRQELRYSLSQAEFPLARRYAELILKSDPDDADSNFAMGMAYTLEDQYSRAETYLKRSLKRRAKEPAIWNNLAVVQFRQAHYDEARQNALKALELMPESVEIKNTLRDIDKAIAERAEKEAAAKNEGAPSTENATPSGTPAKKPEGGSPKSE